MWASCINECVRDKEGGNFVHMDMIRSVRLPVDPNRLETYIMPYLKHLWNCNGVA